MKIMGESTTVIQKYNDTKAKANVKICQRTFREMGMGVI